jgi:hypothetical protein
LAVYLLVIGMLNLSRRPFVTSGARDLIALGVGVSGLAVVGPIELLTETRVVLHLGPSYWFLVLGLYFSGVLTLALHARPRLVVYNISPEAFRAALETVAREADSGAHWAGETLVLPTLQTQLLVEPFAVLRNVSLVALGETHNLALWRFLHAGLRDRLTGSNTAAGLGLGLVLLGVAMFTVIGSQWLYDPVAVTRGFMEMLGRG